METSPIKDVAIYLRKSRGDEDKDLEKHREALLEIVKTNNWRYVTFQEIAMSESIVDRPKFSQLLAEVIDGMYDAVMVESYDRLGRGEEEDQGKIRNAFKSSGTYVVTPEKIYDLNNESDEDHYKFKGFFANWEYTSIKRRLNRGKKRGSKRGEWTNGKPPYPYIYVAAIKGIQIDNKHRIIYDECKERILRGESLHKIEWDLNNRALPSPNGGIWHSNTIRRMLIDETHLGNIISNKTKGSGHLKKRVNASPLTINPRSDWTIVENCHEAVKTLEEHASIISILEANKLISSAAKMGVYPLSALIFCGMCKKMMRFDVRSGGLVQAVKSCNKYDHYGNYCVNRGLPLGILRATIDEELADYEKQLLDQNSALQSKQIVKLERLLLEKESQLEKSKKALAKIKEMFESDDYTKEEYDLRKEKRLKEIREIDGDIHNIKSEIDHDKRRTNEDKIAKIKNFYEIWGSPTATNGEKNRIAKQVIERIEYTHDKENNINIKLDFQ